MRPIDASRGGVGRGARQAPVERFWLVAPEHVTGLPRLAPLPSPTAAAKKLSAWHSAVLMGSAMTSEVLALKMRGESDCRRQADTPIVAPLLDIENGFGHDTVLKTRCLDESFNIANHGAKCHRQACGQVVEPLPSRHYQ